MYVLHIETQYRKQILMNIKEDVDNKTVLVGTLTFLHISGWIIHTEISKETDLQGFFRSNGLNRYVYRTFHPITESTLFQMHMKHSPGYITNGSKNKP